METDQGQRTFNRLFASLAFPDAPYVLLCDDCGTLWKRERDCKTTKAARRGDAHCPKCGTDLELIRDRKAD